MRSGRESHRDLSTLERTELKDYELIALVRDGDQRSLETLLDRYQWLAGFRATSYFLEGAERDDVKQEAMVGLFKAIRDFDIHSDTPFSAFADLCIHAHIQSAVKMANRYKHHPLNSSLPLDCSAPDDEDGSILRSAAAHTSLVDDPAVLAISSEEIDAIRDHLARALTDLEREVLQLHINGVSYRQIAETLNTHLKGIDNALQRARRKLRNQLRARLESVP